MSWYNPYIAIPLVAWFCAHLFKFLTRAAKGKASLSSFYESGGMPSAHSASVTALAVTALLYSGYSSPIFGLAVVFAVVVIYDSFGVRRAAGEQAVAINALAKAKQAPKVRQVHGHQPGEVIAGILLGAAVALAMGYHTWV